VRELTTILTEEKINITAMNTIQHEDHTVTVFFTLEMKGLVQLSRLLGRIEGIRGVISVFRVGDESTIKTDKST
ncbi:MAG: hypothetical protein JSU76_02075, partial [Dehalococcoidia bacterium]